MSSAYLKRAPSAIFAARWANSLAGGANARFARSSLARSLSASHSCCVLRVSSDRSAAFCATGCAGQRRTISANRDGACLFQRENRVVGGLACVLAFRLHLGDRGVLLGSRLPLLESVEDLRIVEAQVVRAFGFRERIEIAAVDVARQPVGGGILRLD